MSRTEKQKIYGKHYKRGMLHEMRIYFRKLKLDTAYVCCNNWKRMHFKPLERYRAKYRSAKK